MTAAANAAAVRRQLIEALRLDLVGPSPEDADLQEEVLPIAPSRWYLAGYLVPIGAPQKQRAVDAEEEMDDPAEDIRAGDDAGQIDRAVTRRIFLSSSMGLSLLAEPDADGLDVTVTWGDYLREEEERKEGAGNGHGRPRVQWRRTPRQAQVSVPLVDGLKRQPVPGGDGLELVRLVRSTGLPTEDGVRTVRAVSLFIVNRRAPLEEDHQDQSSAFQVRLEVASASPLVPRCDLRGLASDDVDDRLADLHYRDVAEYAVGHNVSVDAVVEGDRCRRVRTTWIPVAAVERVEPAKLADVTFGMEALAGLADGAAAGAALAPLVGQYRAWIDGHAAVIATLSPRRREVAEYLVQKARAAAGRIEDGIGLLAEPKFLQAFRIANRAMAMAARRRRAIEEGKPPEEMEPPRWRPFQLAFLLVNLRGIVSPTHGDREIVDLLFFPTGGGKTEAYLGLAAFTLVWRRLRDPAADASGLSVLMRYTLRLLTLDQLGRAAAMICALELIREADPAALGSHPFEIALWVGRAATPNRMGSKGDNDEHTARVKALRYQADSRRDPPLPLEQCPWCGTRFVRESFRLEPNCDHPTDLLVRCVDRDCDFNRDRWLPIVAVDEPIYRRLPGFMIATVDKFAAMPWTGEVARFFGRVGPAGDLPPPDLIIQDELHLISGPLGTMAGLYETALDALCTREVDGKRLRPKVIASTATVRWADKQIRALFDRTRTEVFPPPGPDRRQSFFARTVPADEAEPRLYAGIAAQGRGPKVIFLRALTTLMAAAQRAWDEAGGERAPDNPADPFMTVVAYFNALRELGSARRIVEDEVRTRLLTYGGRKRVGEAKGLFADRRFGGEPLELTSRVGTAEVAQNKRRLASPFADTQNRVDVALATNMISVGLDITRLGLMAVSGQPKTTAEYIQATSRVGRDPRKPGLIVTLLNVHKPRDRSHYERFGAYHASFYRGVEATSVTPFSPRALDRGLPAVSVGLARLGTPDLTPQNAAARVRDLPTEVDAVARAIGDRAERHRMGTGHQVRNRARSLLDDWIALAEDYAQSGTSFGYQRGPGVSKPLLREMLDPERKQLRDIELRFRAPRSLRDVEPNVLLRIESPDGKELEA